MRDIVQTPEHTAKAETAGTAPPRGAGRAILIVGAGASGTILAITLAKRLGPEATITLIDPAARVGRGVAYAQPDRGHLLNSPAEAMGVLAEAPGDFADWLAARGMAPPAGGFAPRAAFGSYLADRYARAATDPEGARILRIEAACIDLRTVPGGVEAHLGDGRRVAGSFAVLATGHPRRAPDGEGLVRDGWASTSPPVDPDGRVLLVGTGLTMADHALALLKAGHRGEIVAVSRRGLLPRAHMRPGSPKLALPAGVLPFGQPLSSWLALVRRLARECGARGGGWQAAIDAIRPHASEIWASLPPEERQRFLRHAAPWWEVHRHRLPPASLRALEAARVAGQFRVLRAGFLGAEAGPAGLTARLAPWAAGVPDALNCAEIRDCRGAGRIRAEDPLVRALFSRGIARPDDAGLGFETDRGGALIAASGAVQERIRALGPPCRGSLWETTAIPEIRAAATRLAAALEQSLA
ncbi:FAD/NAD(P)-binding protein [Frigidibacter sp. MR17.14]|uniref:FAD/NAD(P)-binding protein n=1 Tax=Frigidibacter sp. MR17.14 TaxID=3126509 RepID=UPI003012A3D3